jgi:hypothetical protein
MVEEHFDRHHNIRARVKMATSDRTCHLLEIPFEVRQEIYQQLVSNLTVHVCPDPFRSRHGLPSQRLSHDHSGQATGKFYDGVMECTGKHYQSLIKAGELSHVCSQDSAHEVSDVLHLMLACRDVYLEIEPLLWSTVTFATGLPQFAVFDMRYLSKSLHSRNPEIVPRASLLQKLILTLPRTELLASEMGHERRYAASSNLAMVDGKVRQSLGQINSQCPNLHSITFIMDATQLECSLDPHQIIVYILADVQAMISFRGLKSFRILYNGSFVPDVSDARNPPDREGLTVRFRHQLESCQHALWEMATGEGTPLNPTQDKAGWLGRYAIFDNDDARINEFCERTIRHYNVWWMGLTVNEKRAINGDSLDPETLNA